LFVFLFFRKRRNTCLVWSMGRSTFKPPHVSYNVVAKVRGQELRFPKIMWKPPKDHLFLALRALGKPQTQYASLLSLLSFPLFSSSSSLLPFFSSLPFFLDHTLFPFSFLPPLLFPLLLFLFFSCFSSSSPLLSSFIFSFSLLLFSFPLPLSF